MIRSVVLFFAVLGCIPLLAEEPAWGQPIDGLRIGVKVKADGKVAPAWVATYASVDEKGVVIPAAFPRQAVLRISASVVRKDAKGLGEQAQEASATALDADKSAAALSIEAKGALECPVAPLLTFEPLLRVSAKVFFRAEAPDDQPEAAGWQDVAESGTVALRRTKTGWAPARDGNGEETKRDDWATPEEVWAEFLARKPEFLEALKKNDWNIRCEAALALAQMGVEAKEAVPGVASLLDQEDPSEEELYHQAIVVALSDLTPHEPTAVAAFAKVLAAPTDGNRKVRLAAVKALGGLTANAEQLATLAKALKDPWSAVRCEAALSLGKLGPAAKEALPALQETAKDPLGVVHEAALEAIKRVSGTQ